MKEKALLFDATKCQGCGACYDACKTENHNEKTVKDGEFLSDHLSNNTFTVVNEHKLKFNGTDVDTYSRHLCMHCDEPTCVSVCPVGAFEKRPTGAVVYDAEKCIGCRYCMQACPHSIPRYEWQSTAPRVRKCIMCYKRVEAGGTTACAEACPFEATVFGDKEEILALAKKRIEENPGVYYTDNGKNGIYGDDEAGGGHVFVLSGVPFDMLGYTPNLPKEGLPELTGRVMEKLPSIVSVGGAFLGGMYWLTKRKNQVAKEESEGKN